MTLSKNIKVAVYTSSDRENVKGLITEIRERMADCVEEVKYVQLPYNISDMQKMKLDKNYYMLLCHSINNRRFSITNVTDALYDDFLKKAKKRLGRQKVGVIAHDFQFAELSSEILESKMISFKNTQERTFRKSILQLIGGQLSDSPVELNNDQWQELEKYLKNILNNPKPKKVTKRRATLCSCARSTQTEP
ncbi:uncharacterized protein LOC121410127 [Lytechinus variegatus]|uniref:uncharacterized protein LOC121410127 n=1 Tax=Lytechinus variegatus TaxID=7654 RepID=UPI001BB15D50|nr:uncharacterized protein LOC121410127 [Lytechinus variegatus]